MRKTVKIDRIREMANGILLHTPDSNKQGREAVQTFVECVLMEAGRYKGFRFLAESEMLMQSENGITPGIRDDVPEHQFDNTDHTRVHYF